MIWAVRNNGLADLYLYWEDGSRETLLEGMPEDYSFGNWFLDAEGGSYHWYSSDSLAKIDAEGKELYRILLKDAGINYMHDLCQLVDGRLIITSSAVEGGFRVLWELDSDTGGYPG